MLSSLRPRTVSLVSISAVAVAASAACRATPVWRTDAGVPTCALTHEVPGADDAVTWHRGPAADRPQLDRWCAGVGPAVIRHAPTVPAPSTATLRELAIISWNTNVGGGDLHGLIGDLRAGRFTDGEPVEHFVLLLQEVYRADATVPQGAAQRPRRIAARAADRSRQDIVDVAAQHGLHLFYVPSMANGRDAAHPHAEDRGNAIVSTLSLVQHTAVELPFEGQRRVAASAHLAVDGGDGRRDTLRVVSVHLDNRSVLRRPLRSFGSGRTRQAEALAATLVRDDTRHLPTVLAGDFNTWAPSRWERAVAVLRTHFPHGHAAPTATFAGRAIGISRALDHMLFRLPATTGAPVRLALQGPSADADETPAPEASPTAPQPVRLDEARGSDHYPLFARLRVGDHFGVRH